MLEVKGDARMGNDSQVPGNRAAILTVSRRFRVPAEVVYDAWLDGSKLGRWLFVTPGGELVRAEADGRVGGNFTVIERRGEVLAEHFGTYLELERPRRIVFQFHTNHEESPTLVTVAIRPLPDGCELTLSHELEPKWESFRDRATAGWTMILEGLGRLLGY